VPVRLREGRRAGHSKPAQFGKLPRLLDERRAGARQQYGAALVWANISLGVHPAAEEGQPLALRQPEHPVGDPLVARRSGKAELPHPVDERFRVDDDPVPVRTGDRAEAEQPGHHPHDLGANLRVLLTYRKLNAVGAARALHLAVAQIKAEQPHEVG